jgi:hypothetical protein
MLSDRWHHFLRFNDSGVKEEKKEKKEKKKEPVETLPLKAKR